MIGEISEFAESLGFIACGIASLEPSRYGDALDAWLKAGYGGTMRYLHRRATERKHPGDIVPGARVAVVVLENYLPAGGREDGKSGNRQIQIAKYARGEDYHHVMMRRLGLLADWLKRRGATIAHPWTDIGPVPERELAERAGLGWIGKNTMLIRPESGSFCLIGSVFTDLAISPTRVDHYDRCGTCTRCLDACPTGAILAPRLLDATRCISYLTIESRQPVPESLVPRMEGWGFGCDICNDVCPWNQRFATPTAVPQYQDRGAVDGGDPGFFDAMDEPQFTERFGDTPLSRPGLSGMRRNWTAAARSLDTR